MPASHKDHLGIVGLLNSSVCCFWLKQVCYPKGGDGIGRGIATERWEVRLAYNGSNIEELPLSPARPVELTQKIDEIARELNDTGPHKLCLEVVPSRAALDCARAKAQLLQSKMIALQEELDWRCYRLYGLHEAAPEHPNPPPLRLGERAFEIVMARRIVAGELTTAWFERHRSTPTCELPTHWPADYRAVVEQRIALIETDRTIGLIEQPEYKRRWQFDPWEEMERDALRTWLLDRMEHARYWRPAEPRILSTQSLADKARHDAELLSVAELYAGRSDFDLDALIAKLVVRESVPFLAGLRYSESGLRKRADWEATWAKQREEDVIDADLAAQRPRFLREAWSRMYPRQEDEGRDAYEVRMAAGLEDISVQESADRLISADAKQRKRQEIGDIPVPPKYQKVDFSSQDYWGLRGGLDVPKERFISFPFCARDADPSMPVLWAGHDHLARARAIAALYVERKESEGWSAERLTPLLAGLLELVPWLLQWHNDFDPDTGLRMGDFFKGYVEEQARELGLTLDDLQTWSPPAPARSGRKRRTAA